MKNCIILGMGYVSPRHLQAIQDVGGNLVAYHDISDVVGHVDGYFLEAKYYRDFLHFDCFVDRFMESGGRIDYAVILLPNHLHNPACRWAMNRGMDVIVEKPPVLFEKNIDELLGVEVRTGKKVSTVLQLRLHNNTQTIKETANSRFCHVNIDYHSARGPWFTNGSWKADPLRSGGLSLSIGIHLHDLVCHLFGKCRSVGIEYQDAEEVKGYSELERSRVNWHLSIKPGGGPKRIFDVDGEQYDLTNGFTDLHTKVYEEVLAGRGFGLEDARESIRICEAIRNQK